MLKLEASAKINLTLKVLGKREDNYHQIETIMQSITLADELTFAEKNNGLELRVEGYAPAGKDNLVYSAALLLRQYTGCEKGATIKLKKNIPMSAGLAGGSTDGATTLIGLNKMWQLGLGQDELIQLATQLGSDVPFCLMGGTLLGQGRGEELSSLPPAPEMGVVLVKPHFGVSTAKVYDGFARAKLGTRPENEQMIDALAKGDRVLIANRLANDLEAVTLELYPQLREIKDRLMSAGALGVLMSGSGPTIFGLTTNFSQAAEIKGKLQGARETVFIATTK